MASARALHRSRACVRVCPAADSAAVNPSSKYGRNTKHCNGKCVYVDDPANGCEYELPNDGETCR